MALDVRLRVDVLDKPNALGEELVAVGMIAVVTGIHHIKNRLTCFLAHKCKYLVGQPTVQHALDHEDAVVPYDKSTRGGHRNACRVFRVRVIWTDRIDARCEFYGYKHDVRRGPDQFGVFGCPGFGSSCRRWVLRSLGGRQRTERRESSARKREQQVSLH